LNGKGKRYKSVKASEFRKLKEEELRQSLSSNFGLSLGSEGPGQGLSLTTYGSSLSGKGLMDAGLAAGIHWGRASGQIHSDMLPFVLCRRDGSFIFDLRWTFRYLGVALAFLKGLGPDVNARKILFVGEENLDRDNPHYFHAHILRAAAKRCGETPMGVREANLFLNQEVNILRPQFHSSAIVHRKKEDSFLATGTANANANVHSKERAKAKAHAGSGVVMSGARGGDCVAAIVLVGGHSEGFGELLSAATRSGCPVVSLVDTSSSLKDISYPIPGNIRSVHSVYFFLDVISYALQKVSVGSKVSKSKAWDVSTVFRKYFSPKK
jgi:ribosomal protein S2